MLSCGIALALNAIQCKSHQRCNGTDRGDLMKGTRGPNEMFARGGNGTIKGFGGEDDLLGQKENDRLLGGDLDDSLYPGPGNDASNGGGDAYQFDNNWGTDTIIDTVTVDVSGIGEGHAGEVYVSRNDDSQTDPTTPRQVDVTTSNSGGTSNSENQVDLIAHC